MNTQWIPGHLKGEERDNHKSAIKASTTLINQFLIILDQMEEELNSRETNPDKMTQDWFVKEVFQNGQRQKIREIRRLFDFK